MHDSVDSLSRIIRYCAPQGSGGTISVRRARDEQICRLRTVRRAWTRRSSAAPQGHAARGPRGCDRVRRGAQYGGQRRGHEALRRRQEGHRRRSGRRAVPRRSVPDEGPHVTGCRCADDARLEVLRRHTASQRRQRACEAAEARGAGDLRTDQHARARPVADLRTAALRCDAQPLGCRAYLGRLERRGRRGRRRAHATDGARLRRVRLDPSACGMLRPGRP